MGKIRGTLRTRRHIFVLLPTTKSLDKSFVFKNDDAKEGLKKMTRLAWAQEVPGSNPGAPTKDISSAFIQFTTQPFTLYFTCENSARRRSDFVNPLILQTSLLRQTSKKTGWQECEQEIIELT